MFKNIYSFLSKYFVHIINNKITQHFNIRKNLLKKIFKKKERFKFNVQFTFFKVFMIFTELETASDAQQFLAGSAT